MACQGGPVPPPLVRMVVVRFVPLLLVLRPRRLNYLHFSEWCHCPSSRYHCAESVPTTLRERPTHVPTANTIGVASLRDLNFSGDRA